ncbi:MAG: hypothetical protein JW928_07945, partial [Candidatus Aureabacteria bacterium]|nr:hypothetical protein [Candidatus Auribacterota bacterium]
MKIRKFGILYNRQISQAKSMADELSVYIAGKGYPVYCESRPRAKTMKHIKILSRRSIISRSDM